MSYDEIKALIAKGASFLGEGRKILDQARSSISDSKDALGTSNVDDLEAMLQKEEEETAAAIADARSAIADYRRRHGP